MKANEAPERIWIDPAADLPKLSGHIDKDSVEYVRTDAFIKKTCEWLFSQANVYSVTHVSNDGGIHTNFYADKMVEDFRKYMKGE